MKILVIGGGGREHALVWKLSRDSTRPSLFCAPGNAGMAELAINVPISAEDVPTLVAWAKTNRPDLTIVGPEVPLCAGLVDQFEKEGLRVFGPCKAAAKLEGSKIFAKEVMDAAGVPTAKSQWFDDAPRAQRLVQQIFMKQKNAKVVIKADGLAAGKGVVVCNTVAEAMGAITEALVKKVFGSAGARVLVEEYLEGEEASVLALVDGEHVVMLSSAQDHKRAFDDDQGPNTGGMGAYSPAPIITPELERIIEREVFGPTLVELRKRGIVYKGVLYAGLMITKSGPKVLEFNCRFGDPETQVILPRIKGDLIPALEACIDGNLTPDLVRWKPQACVCVVAAADGYPGHYEKGMPIVGISEARSIPGVEVFHAGTKTCEFNVVVNGGRVLGITALKDTIAEAVDTAYKAVKCIRFSGMRFRSDIGARALKKS
ncbi:MAG: phosphoribosylamine--glycine ligase [Candidatus Staskawiczbacteria bacterium]|nr:phosphoribosylamine--glycine ligase [Candidatus Staskawiczbacteria bacterium]